MDKPVQTKKPWKPVGLQGRVFAQGFPAAAYGAWLRIIEMAGTSFIAGNGIGRIRIVKQSMFQPICCVQRNAIGSNVFFNTARESQLSHLSSSVA